MALTTALITACAGEETSETATDVAAAETSDDAGQCSLGQGTFCTTHADWCAWLDGNAAVAPWKLTVSGPAAEACAIAELEAQGATDIFAEPNASGSAADERIVSATGTWLQVGALCRSNLVSSCHSFGLELEYCGTLTTQEACDAQPTCQASAAGVRVSEDGSCRDAEQFAVCRPPGVGCDAMEGVYRSPAGACWKFAGQCDMPDSWGKPGPELCPETAEIDALPVCGAAFDFASHPVGDVGPWKVGYRTTDVTYDPPGAPAGRTIKIHVWYPSTVSEGEHPRWYGIFSDPVAVIDAPLAPVPWAGKWPVFVHSHGHQGYAGNSSFVHRYFASHGWVVAVPDHTGNTLGDNLDPRPRWMYFVRSLDVSKTVDTLVAGFPGLESASLDTGRVLLGGHSYGVFTGWASLGATFASGPEFDAGPCSDCTTEEKAAFAAGGHDPRFVAGVLMAGSISRDWFGPDGHKTVKVPILSMSGTADIVGAKEQFETTAGLPLTWIEIEGACHQSFGLEACETLAPEEGSPLIRTWALAFGRRHILGDTSMDPLLTGTDSLSPKIVVKHHD